MNLQASEEYSRSIKALQKRIQLDIEEYHQLEQTKNESIKKLSDEVSTLKLKN